MDSRSQNLAARKLRRQSCSADGTSREVSRSPYTVKYALHLAGFHPAPRNPLPGCPCPRLALCPPRICRLLAEPVSAIPHWKHHPAQRIRARRSTLLKYAQAAAGRCILRADPTDCGGTGPSGGPLATDAKARAAHAETGQLRHRGCCAALWMARESMTRRRCCVARIRTSSQQNSSFRGHALRSGSLCQRDWTRRSSPPPQRT